MRVISGKAKGRKLKQVPGDSTRPIMDRVKENLFNLLGDFTLDTRWLDLFAGTGQVGIEALSRGATEVVFVDNARPAVRVVHDNLRHTRLDGQAQVRQTDALRYLQTAQQPFDLIFVAPPQYKKIWITALQAIDHSANRLLTPGGRVVVQIDPKEDQTTPLEHLQEYDRRTYGNTTLIFYETKELSADKLTS